MKLSVEPLIFLGLTVALWLALGLPGVAFFAEAWIATAAWLLFGVLATFPNLVARFFEIDRSTYGMVAIAFGSVVPAAAALLATAMLLVARYLGTGSDTFGRWSTHPILGAVFVILLIAALVPISLLARRTLGSAGIDPVIDPRAPMRSHPEAPKSRVEFQASSGGRTEERQA